VNATLAQIQNASRMPSGGISETSVSAVLAFIEAASQKTRSRRHWRYSLHACGRGGPEQGRGAYGDARHVAIMAAASARLLRAFATQVEAMRRLRSGGTQGIGVERIEVSDTAQAIIGNVNLQRHQS